MSSVVPGRTKVPAKVYMNYKYQMVPGGSRCCSGLSYSACSLKGFQYRLGNGGTSY